VSYPDAHDGCITIDSIPVALPRAKQIAGLEGADHDRVLWALEKVRRQIEASIAEVMAQADGSVRYLADGHRGVKSRSMAVTNCSPGEAAPAHRARASCQGPKPRLIA
jgi:hypothetical protein